MSRSIIGAFLICFLLSSAARAAYFAPAFPNLPSFQAPIDIQDPRDGTDRLFVVERAGRIYVFVNDVSVTQRSLFLDISDSVTTQTEGGLLGLAFHPNYENNGYFYVTYTIEDPRRTILARFTRNAGNPNLADRNTELRVLVLPQVNLHHKGGCLAFGTDGYLYMTLGEDGVAQLAQDLTRLEGKLLRLDVDHPTGGKQYRIPPDNPFEGNNNGWREEIWSFGFRNPWRFSIDAPTGRIWIGDVGQDEWEEIDLAKKGRNFGWPRMEGPECYSPPGCDTTGLNIVPPLFVYPHDESASITGGYVYRGTSVPSLVGKYVYADYLSGEVWALTYNGVNPPTNALVHVNPNVKFIGSFGTDRNNELYFTSFDGEVYRFFETSTGVTHAPPARDALTSAYPNPFSGNTTVSFTSPTRSHARLDVFDVKGRMVASLLDRSVEAGDHTAQWEGRGARGEKLPGGIYFVRLTLDDRAAGSRRIVLLR